VPTAKIFQFQLLLPLLFPFYPPPPPFYGGSAPDKGAYCSSHRLIFRLSFLISPGRLFQLFFPSFNSGRACVLAPPSPHLFLPPILPGKTLFWLCSIPEYAFCVPRRTVPGSSVVLRLPPALPPLLNNYDSDQPRRHYFFLLAHLPPILFPFKRLGGLFLDPLSPPVVGSCFALTRNGAVRGRAT